MHTTNELVFIFLLLGKNAFCTNMMVKRNQKVCVSNIITVEKDVSLITCQIKCNRHQECYEIGTDANDGLGMIGNCYLLRNNDHSDSRGAMSNPSIVTKEMYVYQKHDLCKTSRCHDDQKWVATGASYNCVCKNGLSTHDCKHPLSCDAIKKSNPKTLSGFYSINPSKPVLVYCDMDIDTDGWMIIANITLPNQISNAEATKLASFQSLSNDIGQLNQVSSGRFRFNPVRLADLDASFQYLHFYCKKPGGRTVSISTVTKNILDYFLLKTNSKPAACSSYKRHPDDNSRLTEQCHRWIYSKWGGLTENGNRVYAFPFYVGYKYHYGIWPERYECDDYDYRGTNAGVWKIYVR